MELDPIDGLVALGLVSIDQASAAARIPDVEVGRFGRLALVGVDVAALLPAVAALCGVPVAPADVLGAPAHTGLAPEAQAALRALPACPLRRAEGGPIDVVLADPAVRARVTALLGPVFRPWLAPEHQVRSLAAKHLVAGPAPVDATSPVAVPAAPSPTSSAPPTSVASNEMAAFVEGHRASQSSASPAVVAAAMAEQVDLSDDEKRRILELDARIDRVSPAELLGVAPDATDDELKESYYALSRAYHPDAHFRRKLGSFKPRVNRIFRGLKKACDALLAEVEERDHLDLVGSEAAAAGAAVSPAGAPPPPPAKTASSSQRLRGLIMHEQPTPRAPTSPSTPAQPTPMPSTQPRPSPRSSGELDLELQAGLATLEVVAIARRSEASAMDAPLVIDPAMAAPAARARLTSAVRAPAGRPTRVGRDRRIILAAVAGGLLIVAVAGIALSRGGGATTTKTRTPAEQQQVLLDRARTATNQGDFAEAVAFASDALRISDRGEVAARAHAVRGSALVHNGDRAEGIADLQEALRRLTPGDPLRAESEAALAKAKP